MSLPFPLNPLGVCVIIKIFPVKTMNVGMNQQQTCYAMALMRRRFTDEEIRKCLISERRDWKNHQGEKRMNAYLERTIAKARAIVQNS